MICSQSQISQPIPTARAGDPTARSSMVMSNIDEACTKAATRTDPACSHKYQTLSVCQLCLDLCQL